MAALAPDLPKVEQQIVEMTNQVRAGQKLSPLKVNAILANAARAYARSLAQSGAFSHNADGHTPEQRAERAGYKFCALAENLAMDRNSEGFSAGALAIQAMAGWMNSPPHRANIMMPAATEIGVGVAEATGQPKFMTVELLGRPVGDPESRRGLGCVFENPSFPDQLTPLEIFHRRRRSRLIISFRPSSMTFLSMPFS